MPIVMMVNRNSASASEIVTGALQDHDRALVVGETTFGKALVQSVYRISGGAGPRADDGALLHAERSSDSASVGRSVRRIPHLHACAIRTRTSRTSQRPEAHRRRPSGVQRRRHRARRRAGRWKASIPPVRPRAVVERGRAFGSFAQRFDAEGDTRVKSRRRAARWSKPNFVVDDAMVADFRELAEGRHVHDRRGCLQEGPATSSRR